jgi:GNAT superfamily N-acetyltransferase
VGRLRAPRDRTSERKKEDCADGVEAASSCDELDDDDAPMSSWSEEKSVAYGPVVATVGVSFDGATRRRFTSLSPPTDCGYLSDLTVTEAERGEGLGRAMMAAAEEFARDMRSPWMYLHVALKKPGVVRLYRDEGYDIAWFDPGILGWRGRLLMRKSMGKK